MPKLPPPPSGPPTPPGAFCAIPQYYHPATEPPTCPGWYFCWSGSQADYLYWPGDWSEVGYWVELPRFIQRLLEN